MMFELMTGKKPYYDANDYQVITLIGQYKLPTAPKTGVSPLLKTFQPLIRECLNQDPSKRPTAAAVMEKIDALTLRIAAAAAAPMVPGSEPPTVSARVTCPCSVSCILTERYATQASIELESDLVNGFLWNNRAVFLDKQVSVNDTGASSGKKGISTLEVGVLPVSKLLTAISDSFPSNSSFLVVLKRVSLWNNIFGDLLKPM